MNILHDKVKDALTEFLDRLSIAVSKNNSSHKHAHAYAFEYLETAAKNLLITCTDIQIKELYEKIGNVRAEPTSGV